MSESSTAFKVAVIGAIATVLAALIGLVGTMISRSGNDSGPPGTDGSRTQGPVAPPAPPLPNVAASVFINPTSGSGGTKVVASGEGFGAKETVVFAFHTEEIGTTTTNAEGKFSNVTLTIPSSLSMFAPQQFSVRANGKNSIRHASAPFMLTG